MKAVGNFRQFNLEKAGQPTYLVKNVDFLILLKSQNLWVQKVISQISAGSCTHYTRSNAFPVSHVFFKKAVDVSTSYGHIQTKFLDWVKVGCQCYQITVGGCNMAHEKILLGHVL